MQLLLSYIKKDLRYTKKLFSLFSSTITTDLSPDSGGLCLPPPAAAEHVNRNRDNANILRVVFINNSPYISKMWANYHIVNYEELLPIGQFLTF